MFILIFILQHFIGVIASFIIAIVPDVPRDVKVQMHRENELEQQMLFEDGSGNGDQNNDKIGSLSTPVDPGSTMTAKEIPSFNRNGSSNLHRR